MISSYLRLPGEIVICPSKIQQTPPKIWQLSIKNCSQTVFMQQIRDITVIKIQI